MTAVSASTLPAAAPADRSALLYDTEASLRLVDGELRALDGGPERDGPAAGHTAADHLRALLTSPAGQPVGLTALPFILERANAEIQGVLANLRDSRTALETATVEKLQHTSEKLKEVTSATEVAATDILDALDRTQGMVDDLEAAEQADDRAKAAQVRDLMREEIFGMMGALQFQDITTQQLAYAASVLSEMESRLLQIARLFDPAASMVQSMAGSPDPRTFDPRATTRGAEQRQALADEIFLVR